MKSIQRRILKNVLEEKKLSRYSYAYRKKVSVLDNAKLHVKKDVIVKLDIKDFFDNITFSMVYDSCFNETLYPKKMGMLFTNLCVFNTKLPAGAPTSGFISNVVLRNFDEKVGSYCEKRNISYTRYFDDLTFSGDFDVKDLIKYVNKLLYEYNFRLNKKKIKVVSKRTRQQVTGIVVNEKVNIRRNYKRKIRQEMYYIKKYGLKSHLKIISHKSDEKTYLLNLLGRINYVYNITKDTEFYNYKKDLTKLVKMLDLK